MPKTSAKFPFSAPSDSLFQWFPWKQSLRHPPLQRAPGAGTPFFFFFSQPVSSTSQIHRAGERPGAVDPLKREATRLSGPWEEVWEAPLQLSSEAVPVLAFGSEHSPTGTH